MTSEVSRRALLKLSTAFVAVPGLIGMSADRGHATVSRKRKNIDDLNPEELNAYKLAIKVLKDRSEADTNDETGYDYQARLHNVIRRHPDDTRGACEHRNEEFFPWHRAHLVGFEELLRSAHPDAANITIPYWDWTKPPSGARFPNAFEDPESPLYHTGRWPPGSGAPMPVWDAEDIKTKVAEPEWNLFAGNAKSNSGGSFGSLERGPHNTLHFNIGPTMGDPNTAAEDPIYWSFHAFIDLIWSRWQERHSQTYQCGNCTIWLEPNSFLVAEMTETTDFGYEYEYDYSIDAQPVTSVSGQPLAARDSGMRTLSVTTAGATASTAPKRTLLRLDGVKVFADITYQLKTYLHPKDTDFTTMSDEERGGYLISTSTIWRTHTGDHDGHERRASLYVDLTQPVAAFGASNWTVTVKAESLPLVAPASEAYKEEKAVEDARLDPLSRIIERVVLENR